MIATCQHCGASLDTRTAEAAEHVGEHAPRGSYVERADKRKRRNERRAAREWKYSQA